MLNFLADFGAIFDLKAFKYLAFFLCHLLIKCNLTLPPIFLIVMFLSRTNV